MAMVRGEGGSSKETQQRGRGWVSCTEWRCCQVLAGRMRFIRSPSSHSGVTVSAGVSRKLWLVSGASFCSRSFRWKSCSAKCSATRVAQSSSESSRGNNPRTTVQGEKAAYEAQASGMQGGCRALSPEYDTLPPHHSLGGACANGKRDQETRMETWGKHGMASILTDR